MKQKLFGLKEDLEEEVRIGKLKNRAILRYHSEKTNQMCGTFRALLSYQFLIWGFQALLSNEAKRKAFEVKHQTAVIVNYV